MNLTQFEIVHLHNLQIVQVHNVAHSITTSVNNVVCWKFVTRNGQHVA